MDGQAAAAVADADGHNNKRMIKSRAGHTITFDDTTPMSGELVIEDDGKGSSITLNAQDGSVTISAEGDLTIKAKGNITLEAADGGTKIAMTATEVNVT